MSTAAGRALSASLVALLIAGSACSVEVAAFDPTRQQDDGREDSLLGGLSAVDVNDGVDVDGPTAQIRIPRFTYTGFDPTGPALGQLGQLEGDTVSVLGSEVGAGQQGLESAFARFTSATGIEVVYTGDARADEIVEELLGTTEQPDVVLTSQPGRLRQLVLAGHVAPLPRLIRDQVTAGYDPFWSSLASVDGRLYGVPASANVKSLVWYRPDVFAEQGYQIPATFGELEALVDQIRSDGLTPWCVGVAAGADSGWPFTDWLEDYVLRFERPAFYDQWVAHEVPFNDARVTALIQRVGDLWSRPGNVYGGRAAIASTSVSQAAGDHLRGRCVLHKQGSRIVRDYRVLGGRVGPGEDVDAFYLPDVQESGRVVLGAGTFAATLSGSTPALGLLSYIAAPDFADNRIIAGTGGYLSAHRLHNTGLYRDAIDRSMANILVSADPFRFDGSDLMPAQVGTDVYPRTATVYASGAIDAWELADEVEAAWPR